MPDLLRLIVLSDAPSARDVLPRSFGYRLSSLWLLSNFSLQNKLEKLATVNLLD